MDRSHPKVKSFDISKRLILEAWEKVRANGGAPGVDAVSISMFEADEINNLYKRTVRELMSFSSAGLG
jgi:RNA-directed DNA polymerase